MLAIAIAAIFAVLLLSTSSTIEPREALAQGNSSGSNDSSNNNDDNFSPSSEGQGALITIPKGAANPQVDLTLQNVGNWYVPKKATVSVGETVTWKNQDTEGHTVTSGLGAGIQSVQTNEQGKPDGIFDSGLFQPGDSWSRTFYNPGTYNYFCTIHPWMEGIVVVSPVQDSAIPNYPVDGSGNNNRQETWPVHTYSSDDKYDIDLKWDPVPILTGQTVTFIADFYTMPANVHSQPTPYDFVVIQNGKELDRVYAITEVGLGAHKYEFSRAGPITIRIESVNGDPSSYSEFSTMVYPDPSGAANSGTAAAVVGPDGATRVAGGTEPVSRIINPVTLVWFTYGIIFSLPAAAAAVIILYKKGKI